MMPCVKYILKGAGLEDFVSDFGFTCWRILADELNLGHEKRMC